jgi:candicidin polyketide synthase FscE
MTSAEGAAYLHRRGLAAMSPELAVRALAQVIDHGEDQVTVADVDWARFTAPFTLRRPAPLLSAVVPAQSPAPAVAGGQDPAVVDGNALTGRLVGLPAAGQERVLLDLVRAEAATVLGHSSPDAVEAGRAFSDLGFDSLTAVELRNRLSQATGLPLPATLLFDYPSQAALASHLRSRLFPAAENSGADVNEADIRRALAAVPLAQFRAAGVMDILLKLANLHSGAEPEASTVSNRIDSISEMDAESLIQMALGDDGS